MSSNKLRDGGDSVAAPALAGCPQPEVGVGASRYAYRDTFKTVGEIRGAAFDLCQQHRTATPLTTELHDSICRAFPSDPDTPVSVPRAASYLLEALKALSAVAEMTTFSDQYPAECEAARAAISRAQGPSHAE